MSEDGLAAARDERDGAGGLFATTPTGGVDANQPANTVAPDAAA